MTREPFVAGQFYAGTKKELISQVEECIDHEFGPKKKSTKFKNIIGAIAPHAGFAYSGPAAATVYKTIKDSRNVDTFIIMAPNHTGRGRTSLILEDYSTPMGIVKVNTKLANKIVKETPIIEDMLSHVCEHSLEVQLPFIQYFFPDAKIVPIVVSSPNKMDEMANGIKKVLTGNECIIASSDFTHYGENFGYAPYTDNIRKNIEVFDMKAISLIEKHMPDPFMEQLFSTHGTICGFLPITLLMKILPKYKMHLLSYYTSSDIIKGSDDNSVSYAAIVFES